MNRIEAAFQHKPIFMPYFPLGYPTIESSIDIIEALAKNGADLIEVGLAFSDPLADGPVIQQATQIALQNGITLKKALAGVAELRRRGVTIPLILMGYYNPILSFGLKNYIDAARSAGADGFIIPDLPPEEAAEFEALCGNLPLISMLAPTTPPERMAKIASKAKGFIYLVSVAGVTGARQQVSVGLEGLISQVKTSTSTPVCVGFGIGTPEQAKQVADFADGVIVGSACVKTIGESENPVEEAKKFANEFAKAIS
ncbi:MAG: tryptophan synthase subunit alpha [Anaerolineae bacterium]|nr:tryptophan synthase subunit alpha [Anaerolineae bacterium]